MFYSHYILAKKGPLGTIWIAAHLEKKLRKNQVNDTNISTSVDSILFPEVPIALRLSGHLLLGVVRIYSRKVNYLFHDCNDALVKLKNAFSSASVVAASVDLPPDAASVPFHSITLPETFEFDDIDVGNVAHEVDHHVTTREQITLEEIVEDDLYPGAQFEQDERFMETPHAMELDNEKSALEDTATPELQEDVLPPMDIDAVPSGPSRPSLAFDDGAVPDVEKLRSASLAGDEDNFDALEKQNVEPVPEEAREDTVGEGSRLVEDEQQPLPSTPVSRSEGHSPSGQRFRDGDGTPALGVVETPVPPARRKNTPGKRKRGFDMELTLSERYMKDMLNDSSDLRRVRRKIVPKEMWVSHKEVLGKRVLNTPCLDGLCPRLEELYERIYNPKRLKVPVPDVTAAADAQHASVPETGNNVQSPEKSPVHVPTVSPALPLEVDSVSPREPHEVPEIPHEIPEIPHEIPEMPALDVVQEGIEHGGATGASEGRESELHQVHEDRNQQAEDGNAAVHHTDRDTDAVDFSFPPPIDSAYLLASSGTDVVSSQSEGWSERTRAIAQCLRVTFDTAGKRPVTVDKLLTGKTRKEAARMFFETLVLRSNDYITVEQQNPYEDITLRYRPKLMKAVF